MKLVNLMNVADNSISMMLSGIRPDGGEMGYDFVEKKWSDNYLFRPERVITVGDFKSKFIYKKLEKNELVDFSTFKTKSIKALKEIQTERGTILLVKVKIDSNNFNFLKAFERRQSRARKNTYHKVETPKKEDIQVYHTDDPANGVSQQMKELEEDFYQTQVLGIPLK